MCISRKFYELWFFSLFFKKSTYAINLLNMVFIESKLFELEVEEGIFVGPITKNSRVNANRCPR